MSDPTAGAAALTVKGAAAELGVSPSLVYALCAAGAIRHERHGLGRGTIRITPAALDEYRLAHTSRTNGGPHPAPATGVTRRRFVHLRL